MAAPFRLPRPVDSAGFELLLLALVDAGLEAGLESGLEEIFVFGFPAALFPAGLEAGVPCPKSNVGLSDFSAGLGFDVSIPKSKVGLSVFSVDFDGC